MKYRKAVLHGQTAVRKGSLDLTLYLTVLNLILNLYRRNKLKLCAYFLPVLYSLLLYL